MWEGGKFLRKLPRHILSLTGTFQPYSTRISPLCNFDDIFYEVFFFQNSPVCIRFELNLFSN